jgi:hypothetical protein
VEDCQTRKEHEHIWGEVEESRMTGTPHRKCQVEGCKVVSLDLDDDMEEGKERE